MSRDAEEIRKKLMETITDDHQFRSWGPDARNGRIEALSRALYVISACDAQGEWPTPPAGDLR